MEEQEPWGLETQIDLFECDKSLITSKETIGRYAIELCKLIDMTRFGEPVVIHFGDNDKVMGYSLVQLIQTSLISGHFSDSTGDAYINVFSCKEYDPKLVEQFSAEFFRASHVTRTVVTGRDARKGGKHPLMVRLGQGKILSSVPVVDDEPVRIGPLVQSLDQ